MLFHVYVSAVQFSHGETKSNPLKPSSDPTQPITDPRHGKFIINGRWRIGLGQTKASVGWIGFLKTCPQLCRCAGGDLATRLVEAAVRAGQCAMDTQTRCVYFKTVAQLVKYCDDRLTPHDVVRLLSPLINTWSSHWYGTTSSSSSSLSIRMAPIS